MNLRPYQIEGRDFLAGRRHALLADEMRVGKTPQAILAAEKLGAESVLVVCPAIAVEHWWAEWRKWSQQSAIPGVTIASYDKLRLHRDVLLRRHYDVAIVDECHFAGNPEAQRTQLIYGDSGVGWHADYLWVLSGTPVRKSAAELWPMLRAFGLTSMDYYAFVRYFCTVDPFTERITGTKVAKIPELKSVLSQFMLRRTRKQVAPEMPAIDYEFLEINGGRHPDYASMDVLNDETAADATRQEIAMAKVPALVEEIAFAISNGLLKQTVVFGWHVEPLYRLADILERQHGLSVAVITGETSSHVRGFYQQGFHEGRIQVMIGNILAVGTAVDLSSASHGYFLELDWLPANNVQAASRLVSLEKDEPVTFDIATWVGSVDDKVQRILLRRTRELSILF